MLRERLSILAAVTVKDTHGSPAQAFRTLETIGAELIPFRATGSTSERLGLQTVNAQIDSRFRIRARGDLTPGMRALWRPSWLASATPKVLEIHGVQPDPMAPTQYQFLDCGEVAIV